MSKVGEFIAWGINQVYPSLAIHRELEIAKRSIAANQQWALEEARRIVGGFEPYWDIHEKNILDIGIGLGGKLPFYIEFGVRSVTGIDINFESVKHSLEHLSELGLTKFGHDPVKLLASDASSLPFDDNHFDVIVSINVFEHIIPLEQALREAYRVLKPDGFAYIHLPPYYSPWGPHLENWIHFPWPHLLFSEKTLMRVAAREDAKSHLNEKFVQAAQIDCDSAKDEIPNVNRVTLHRFHKKVQQTGFTIVQLQLLPIGYDNLKTDGNLLKYMTARIFAAASKLPIVQEAIVTKMVYVLKKAS